MISIHEQFLVVYGYLHSLWRFRWSALIIAWIVAISGWLVVYTLPDKYTSRAAVHIDTSSVMQPLLKGLAVELNPEREINVMSRMLLNRESLLSVIRETDMDHDVKTPQGQEMLIANLSNNIQLKNMGGFSENNRIYEISYTSGDAETAFKVVFTLLNTLIESTLKSGRMDTVMAEEFLDEQIKDYEKRLEQGEARLAEFKKKNSGFMPNEKGGYYDRLQRQQELIDRTDSALRLAKQRYNDLRQQLSGESPMFQSSQISGAAAAKLRALQEQLNEMLTQYTDEHPNVKALRARIADLEQGLDPDTGTDTRFTDETKVTLNPVYQDLKAQESRARVEVSTLQVQLAEQRQKLVELQQSVDIIPQVEADLVKLNRDYDITKERYLALVERREAARLAQKVEKNNSEIIFRVVEAPVVPLLPSGPRRSLLLFGVFAVALMAGVGWSLLRFLLYPTFVDFKQLQKMIDLPVLGTIALQMTPEKRRQRRLELTSFLLVVLLMFGFFGGVVVFQQQGSGQVRTLIAEIVK
ncbi:MAG: GNVR domain-containing protein [Pseudomonadota bacterium]